MKNLFAEEDRRHSMNKIATMVFGATMLLIAAFTIWGITNWDVLWKAIRFPEAVRQMQIEVLIKK